MVLPPCLFLPDPTLKGSYVEKYARAKLHTVCIYILIFMVPQVLFALRIPPDLVLIRGIRCPRAQAPRRGTHNFLVRSLHHPHGRAATLRLERLCTRHQGFTKSRDDQAGILNLQDA